MGGNIAVNAAAATATRPVARREVSAKTTSVNSANNRACAAATSRVTFARKAVDTSDKQRISRCADRFGNERLRVGSSREHAGGRQHMAEPLISDLVLPRGGPSGCW